MIRLFCTDGPHKGETFDRPVWLDGPVPPLVVLECRGGVYVASPPELPGWPCWEAHWLPVGERARDLVAA